MMPRLSAQDEQLLSDYLDGQLSERDAVRFEERLKDDANLRTAAADLRRLKIVLRRAPRYPLPRNFMLTPTMLQKPAAPKILFWLPVMRLASAAAVFLLAASFVLEMLPGGAPEMRANQIPAAAAPMMDSAPPTDSAGQVSAPPIIMWNSSPANGRGGGGGPVVSEAQPQEKQMGAPAEAPAETGEAVHEEPQALIAPAQILATPTMPGQQQSSEPSTLAAPEAAKAPEMAFQPTPAADQAEPPSFKSTLPVSPPSEITSDAAAPAVEGDNSEPAILGIRPTDERALMMTPEGQPVPASGEPAPAAKTSQQEGTPWLWIKIALAAAALATGTAAVLLQRKARM